jgi:hypothetical protein
MRPSFSSRSAEFYAFTVPKIVFELSLVVLSIIEREIIT